MCVSWQHRILTEEVSGWTSLIDVDRGRSDWDGDDVDISTLEIGEPEKIFVGLAHRAVATAYTAFVFLDH